MPVTYFLSVAEEQSEGKEKQIFSWIKVYTSSQVEILTALPKKKNRFSPELAYSDLTSNTEG